MAELFAYGTVFLILVFLVWSTAAYWVGVWEEGKRRLR